MPIGGRGSSGGMSLRCGDISHAKSQCVGTTVSTTSLSTSSPSNVEQALSSNRSDYGLCSLCISPHGNSLQFPSGTSSSLHAPSKYADLFSTTACAIHLSLARNFIRREIG